MKKIIGIITSFTIIVLIFNLFTFNTTLMSKKQFILLIISACFINLSNAQDIIHLKDNTKLKVVIEEIKANDIFFRKYGETDLNTYSIKKTDATKINYENGDVVNLGENERIVISKVIGEKNEEINNQNDIYYLRFRKKYYSLLNNKGLVIHHKLSNTQVIDMLEGHDDMIYNYQKYKSIRKVKRTLMFTSLVGMVAGYPVLFYGATEGQVGNVGGQNPYLTTGMILAGTGVAILLIRIPFAVSANSHGRKVADSYNSYIRGNQDRYSLNFGPTRNGIGLTFKF